MDPDRIEVSILPKWPSKYPYGRSAVALYKTQSIFLSGGGKNGSDEVFSLNLTNETWTAEPNLNRPLESISSCCAGSFVYVFNGHGI